jgi:hypothetical protein
MKSVSILFILFSFALSAQVHFEKGYVITKDGVRTECLIKNRKWVKTPQLVVYKLSENGEPLTAGPGDLTEWAVGSFRFVAGEVDFDESTMDVAKIGYDKEPVWIKRRLFVRLLVEGKASLYLFEEGDGNRFFLSTEENTTIRQLVNKPFHKSSIDIYYNDLFRAQLLSEVFCEGLKIDTENVKYTRSSLRNYFTRYNECVGIGEPAERIVDKKKFEFHLTITPGADLSMFRAESFAMDTEFDKEISRRYGTELEVVLPFNTRKWSFFVEPTYQSYRTANPFPASLKSIEVPVGMRHYFYLTNSIRVFVNAAGVFDRALESKAKYHELIDAVDTPKSVLMSAAFGAGIKIWRFGAELRYYTPRSRLDSKRIRHFEQEKISLIVGLRIF